jgi:hypothetical protein
MKKQLLELLESRPVQVIALALGVLVNVATAGVTEKVIFPFNQTGGSQPLGGLVSDGAGNLYGTTSLGGLKNRNYAAGAVFELSPASGGTWSETVIYEFRGVTEGQSPNGTLVFDKQGNIYGTAQHVLFELTKGTNGTWSENIIHRFDSNEGAPNGDLTWDSAGNLYGTTPQGGLDGEVFELSPQPNGTWTEHILYSFPSTFGLGSPVAGVAFDSKGNLYGAAGGSSNGLGGIYQLSPQGNGEWTATAIYIFTGGSDGRFPNSRLVLDSNGNLFGTTTAPGEVFELSPFSGGTWKETTLHTFTAQSDGDYPQGALAFDSRGNLYGTTTFGGLGCNGGMCGIAYRLTPQAGGAWTETILHQFESAGDGSQPQAGMIVDNAGHLFGTTKYGGGRYGYGTVFEISY